MPIPVVPQVLYIDRLETTIGTLLLIHDLEGHVRALDFHDFESAHAASSAASLRRGRR